MGICESKDDEELRRKKLINERNTVKPKEGKGVKARSGEEDTNDQTPQLYNKNREDHLLSEDADLRSDVVDSKHRKAKASVLWLEED